MQVSFGPQADQYRGYTTNRLLSPPGTTGVPTDVKIFYSQTRARYWPWTFSAITLVAPLVIFSAAAGLIAWMLSDGHPFAVAVSASTLKPPLPVDAFRDLANEQAPLLNGIFSTTIRFGATHVALLAACLLALVVSVASTHNILSTHNALGASEGADTDDRWVWLRVFAFWLLLPIALGATLAFIATVSVGDQIATVFDRMFPLAAEANCKPGVDLICAVLAKKEALDGQMLMGAVSVTIGVVALIMAAATATYRFEIRRINGAWSDSYVLRHKLNSLLTLFFLGSIVLVITNIALSSAMDWSGGVLDLIDAATSEQQSKSVDAATPVPLSAKDADAKALAKAVSEDFDSIKTLRAAVASFGGLVGSLLLIGIFVPALYGLTSEIEIAGKCHAYYDMIVRKDALKPPDPDEPIYVAGWDTVKKWKASHGLNLSFTDLTGSFVAVLAPLLSGAAIDLAKLVTGPPG